MAVVCAVRHTATAVMPTVIAAAMTPASGHRRATPVIAAAKSAVAISRALATPKLVGRRCVPTRSSVLPAP
jgi:hypothetical protein